MYVHCPIFLRGVLKTIESKISNDAMIMSESLRLMTFDFPFVFFRLFGTCLVVTAIYNYQDYFDKHQNIDKVTGKTLKHFKFSRLLLHCVKIEINTCYEMHLHKHNYLICVAFNFIFECIYYNRLVKINYKYFSLQLSSITLFSYI